MIFWAYYWVFNYHSLCVYVRLPLSTIININMAAMKTFEQHYTEDMERNSIGRVVDCSQGFPSLPTGILSETKRG